MKRQSNIDYKAVLSLFLPKDILTYFDIIDFCDMGSYYMICLEEYNQIPDSLKHLDLVSKGFYPEITINDFPARDRTVYLRIKRRRWEDKTTGKTYSRDWNLIASGTRITAEFGAFLKELLRQPRG